MGLIVTWCACAGEIPLEIIRMKAKGIIPGGLYCGLRGNEGFTLPSNIGELGDDITELDLSNCSLTGPLSTRTERLHVLLTFQLFGRRIAQGARQFDQFDPFLRIQQFSVR